MIASSAHNHTTFCDGHDTPAAMAEAALKLGFTDFGFSGHTWTPFDPTFGIRDEAAYVAALRQLEKQYAGRLRIAVGLEQDVYGPVQNRAALDYIIGSVHEICGVQTGRYYDVDGSAETLAVCRDVEFGGDIMALLRRYYALLCENTLAQHPEILGHFDLVCKNNEGNAFFDEDAPEYRAIALEALEGCLSTDAILEVNTGGMARGYRTRPYPARFVLEYAREKGARVMVAADAHSADRLDYHFAQTEQLLRDVGFRTVTVLQNGRFVEQQL